MGASEVCGGGVQGSRRTVWAKRQVIIVPEMLCGKCSRDAIIYRKHSGEALCREHFVEDFETNVKRAVEPPIVKGERVAVAFSGGKDSSVLLYALNEVLKGVELIAVTIDEGRV